MYQPERGAPGQPLSLGCLGGLRAAPWGISPGGGALGVILLPLPVEGSSAAVINGVVGPRMCFFFLFFFPFSFFFYLIYLKIPQPCPLWWQLQGWREEQGCARFAFQSSPIKTALLTPNAFTPVQSH